MKAMGAEVVPQEALLLRTPRQGLPAAPLPPRRGPGLRARRSQLLATCGACLPSVQCRTRALGLMTSVRSLVLLPSSSVLVFGPAAAAGDYCCGHFQMGCAATTLSPLGCDVRGLEIWAMGVCDVKSKGFQACRVLEPRLPAPSMARRALAKSAWTGRRRPVCAWTRQSDLS